MSTRRDWAAWHEAYDNPDTPLAQRLLAVQARIAEALDRAAPGPLRAISICAGQGRDLIGVLREHPRRRDVTARLVELDPRNAAAARQRAADAGLTQVEVVTGDAAQTRRVRRADPGQPRAGLRRVRQHHRRGRGPDHPLLHWAVRPRGHGGVDPRAP